MATSGRTVPQPRPQWQITEDYIDSLKDASGRRRYNPAFLDALKDQLALRDGLSGLRSELTVMKGHVNSERIAKSFNATNDAAHRISRFIGANLGPDVLMQLPTNESAIKAQQVFEIPELAEMILMFLDIDDLLNAMQVNTTSLASIESSINLQRKLFREPHLDAAFDTFFNGVMSGEIGCTIHDDERQQTSREGEVEVMVTVPNFERWSKRRSRSSGQVLQHEKMLVCQPPVYEMSGIADCCFFYNRKAKYGGWMYQNSAQPPPPTIVKSVTGFTAGEISPFAKRIAQQHQHCPFAEEWQHNKVGVVEAGVRFFGRLLLDPKDPAAPRQYKNEPGPGSPDYSGESDGGRVNRPKYQQRYIDAKREAFEDGAPVPTFEERQKNEERIRRDEVLVRSSNVPSGQERGEERDSGRPEDQDDNEDDERYEGDEGCND